MGPSLTTEGTFIPAQDAPPPKQKGDAQRNSSSFSLLRGDSPVDYEAENIMKAEVVC
jgi:hypothetical protein